MHLLFLGTAASEGYPNAFCHCENCNAARQEGGASLRKRSSVLIDGQLLIDLGPDLMAAAQQHNVSLAEIRYCLQTHEHADHLDPSNFDCRSQYCGVYGTPRLQWYASQGAIDLATETLNQRSVGRSLADPEVAQRMNLDVHVVKPFQAWAVGPYSVLSVQACHAPELTAMLFVIERAGRVLFYCTDTADLPDETWLALHSYGKRFHAVVIDHTFGLREQDAKGHMTANQVCAQMARMRQLGLVDDDTQVLAQHIGHHSNPPHSQLEVIAKQRGYGVAYDGMALAV